MILNGKEVIVMDLETAENLLKAMKMMADDNPKKTYLKLAEKGLLKDFDELNSLVRDLTE